ncbi:MAG: hypothetical protein LBU32_18605 [Clostridiales bacterium]|nr:hypothetical protein [Clostridiales bacterium]
MGGACIGALKADRVAFPGDMKISAVEFAKIPGIPDFSLDEAKKPERCVYRYEGELNGIESAAVLSKEFFGKPAALREFICTDASLDIKAILEYYGSMRHGINSY